MLLQMIYLLFSSTFSVGSPSQLPEHSIFMSYRVDNLERGKTKIDYRAVIQNVVISVVIY